MRRADDTIFAPAGGAAAAAISVIRLSGPQAHDVIAKLTRGPLPAERQLVRRRIRSLQGDVIDDAMIVVFGAGRSFNGERMAEIHCHGGRAVVRAICDLIGAFDGCRMAEPGELSRRAFENGRMDLSEAEGLADLITADTERQRRQAMRLMSGTLTERTVRWREDLLRACALIEVTIDWVDEDIPEDVMPEVQAILSRTIRDLGHELSMASRTAAMRAGFEVAIVGAPNAGKSSLLNALAGRDAAIVSPIAGTTRDVIELRYDLSGYPVIFLDTAGVRGSSDHLERLGIEKAVTRAADADLRLLLQAPDVSYGEAEETLYEPGDLRVWAKADIVTGPGDVVVSVHDGRGISELLDRIRERLDESSAEIGLLGHDRQQDFATRAHAMLEECAQGLCCDDVEVSAMKIREAMRMLDGLIGRVSSEDVLDVVFGSFCLGK